MRVDKFRQMMWYNILAGTPGLFGREVIRVELLLALLTSVEAGLLVELICKWLDGDGRR